MRCVCPALPRPIVGIVFTAMYSPGSPWQGRQSKKLSGCHQFLSVHLLRIFNKGQRHQREACLLLIITMVSEVVSSAALWRTRWPRQQTSMTWGVSCLPQCLERIQKPHHNRSRNRGWACQQARNGWSRKSQALELQPYKNVLATRCHCFKSFAQQTPICSSFFTLFLW